jgi:hypothetical protein
MNPILARSSLFSPNDPRSVWFPDETLWLLVLLAVGVVVGLFTAKIAGEKGYSKPYWFLAGFFLSPLAFLAAIGLPDKLARLMPSRGDRIVCDHGGVEVPGELVTLRREDGFAIIKTEDGVLSVPVSSIRPRA